MMSRGTVLVAGPDGAGKTTVADAIARAATGAGIRVTRAHFRPGLLLGRATDGAPVTEPHAQPPRGALASLAKLALVAADFLVAAATTWRTKRDGLLILERGWFDQVVDPRRYRLSPAAVPVARTLGRLLPRADVAVVIGGDPDAIVARKPELAADEVARQHDAWRHLAPFAARRVVSVDGVTTPPEHAAAAALAAPRPCDLAWRRAPLAPARLALRVTAGAGARPALAIYRPSRPRAALAAHANRALLAAGLAPAVDAPTTLLDDLADALHVTVDGAAAMRSPQPGRLVLGLAAGGRLTHVAKIGPAADPALPREAEVLERLAGVSRPFQTPRLRWYGRIGDQFVLVTDAVDGSEHAPLFRVGRAVTVALALARGPDGHGPIVHGDFSSWNFLETVPAATLLDWESSADDFRPLVDLAHFVTNEGAHLRRYPPHRAVELLTTTGSPGHTYLEELAIDPEESRGLVHCYLNERLARHPRDLYADEMMRSLA